MITHDILDHIGDAIYGLDPAWNFTFFNRKAEEVFALGRHEVMGLNLWDCFPTAKDSGLSGPLRLVMSRREPVHLDFLSPTTGQWAEVHIFPLDDGGLGVSWRDLSERKKQEIALQEAVENQDVLFRELAHRVTNNFQELAARLHLQGRAVQDPGARDMCEKMAVSIRCMALVHRRLYSSHAHIDDQDLGDYVRALCDDLSSSLPDNLGLSAVAEPGTPVSVDVATTVGMMVAELVMNSRKYAWAPGQQGRMVVTMRRQAKDVEVELRDDGRGVPEGLDLRASPGLGLKLLNLQINRLQGSFTHRNVEGGAIFLLRFPIPAHEPVHDPAPRVEAPADAAPGELGRLVNGQKIWNHGLSLAGEADAGQRAVLQSRLLREEDRFGACSDKLEAAHGVMAALAERIEAQRRRIDRLRGLGCDTTLATQMLQQFETTSQLFGGFADRIERELATIDL